MIKKKIIGLIISVVISSNVIAAEISTYLYAEYNDIQSVITNLESNGFDILGEYDAMGDEDYHVIAFTNNTLEDESSKENRGFAGVLKVLISENDDKLILTNPNYFLRAFMQEEYRQITADNITKSLTHAFGKLKGSVEVLDDDDISDYHYMFGLPRYEDMVEIAEGRHLVDTIKDNAGDKLVFELNLDSSTVLGIAMDGNNGEKSYISKINGQKHSVFEPYMILVEDNKAKIMHVKYYLALAYPNLSMSVFMNISSAPEDIENFMKEIATKK